MHFEACSVEVGQGVQGFQCSAEEHLSLLFKMAKSFSLCLKEKFSPLSPSSCFRKEPRNNPPDSYHRRKPRLGMMMFKELFIYRGFHFTAWKGATDNGFETQLGAGAGGTGEGRG